MEKLVSEETGVTRPPPAPNLPLYAMAENNFAYDGEKALYTRGAIPQKQMEFTVKRFGSPGAAKIPMGLVALTFKGFEIENTGDALGLVIDIILRQQAAKRCFLVQKSFHDDVRDMVDVGGATACRGFHSRFRTTQGGLSLNMDVSSTMILTLGPVFTNPNLEDPRHIDWGKAKKMLKNTRVKARHSSMEFKIIGISEKACSHQYFPMKMRSEDGSTEEIVDIIEYECFVKNRKIGLDNSAYIPKCPNYLPLELCFLVSLRQYTKALSSMQRASLVEKSRQKPEDRIRSVTDDVKNYRFDDDPLLKACGMSIQKQSTAFEGRMLNAPTLKIGNGEDCIPHNGKWNFNLKQFLSPIEIKRWANVNFYARCDTSYLSQEMINSGSNKGIVGYVHPVFINWAAENRLLILSVKSWTQARADHNR